MGKILNYIAFFAAAAILIVVVQACNTGDCLDNKSSVPLAGFYSSSAKSSQSLDSLTVFGIGAPGDSLILDNESSVSKVYLPLRSSATTSKFVLQYNKSSFNGVNDTLTVNYTPYPYFVSAECGAMYNFDLKDFSCTTHRVDSVVFTATKFTNVDVESIKIFMKE
jgi:hypothetical protein